MSSANRSRKSKDTDNIQSEIKDIKKEMSKTSEKSLPTAEQMRIAEIIDTKTEDPTLKEKLKQVMDATQKSIDEAFIALHDCDNDPNRAVNMLLEGIGSEWSTSSKKKKNRTKEKQPTTNPEISVEVNRDSSQVTKPFGNKPDRRGRGRGYRGNRGDLSNSFVEREKRDTNGPMRERGSRGRNQNRDFGRGRGSFRKPIETWDPYTPGDDSKNFAPDPDDWDNEEYTGSLANSLIITSSSTGNTPPPVNPSPYLNEKNDSSDTEKKTLESFIVKPTVSEPELTPLAAAYFKQYTSTVNEVLPVNMSSVRGNMVVSPEKNIRATLPTSLPMGQEIRQTRAPNKIPPPSKIPSGPVEMPPDSADNNIGLLDVQFGALELENASETISPTPPHHTPSPTISDKQLHHQVGSPSDGLLLNETTTSFSPVRSNTTLPHIPELVTKVSEVSSSLYQEPTTYQSSSSNSKTTQPVNSSNYTTSYSSGQVNSTSSIIYSSNSNQNTYTSTGIYGGSSNSYPHYQYGGYPSQQATLQMLANSSNSYQSVLGSQQYGSNTQTAYGASGLAPPVYPSQYPTYNSNIQHIYKQNMAPPTSTNSKDYETNQPTVNLTAISHTGSMSPTSTLLSASSATTKPSSLSSSMGKSGMVTNLPPNMPTLVGTHQYIMGQGTIPFFQQPQPMYIEDIQLMQQQRLAPHIGATGYYEMGYQTSGGRDGYQYGMTDGRYARADTSSGTGTTSGHGASNSGVYGKIPFTANYGMYDSQGRGNAGDFKSTQALPKGVNPLSSSDSSVLYPKSHTGLPKVSAYEAQGYHGGPPMGSHPGLGPGDGYAQHVFIPTMTPHRAATLMHHQPIHQDGGLNPRSASETQQNKVGITKTAY